MDKLLKMFEINVIAKKNAVFQNMFNHYAKLQFTTIKYIFSGQYFTGILICLKIYFYINLLILRSNPEEDEERWSDTPPSVDPTHTTQISDIKKKRGV